MPIAIISVLLVIASVVMWFVLPELLIGLGIGLGLGMALLIAILRKLGHKAGKSTIAPEVFYKITNYKATVYNIPTQQPKTIQTTVYGNGHDYADLMDILKNQMRFPANTAKEAAKHAINEAYGQPLQEKIRVALQYVGNGNKDTPTRNWQ